MRASTTASGEYPALLDARPPKPVEWPRCAASIRTELRTMQATGELELPLPGSGDTRTRWAALARWGRRDLTLARLAEGHTDALAILAEAGRSAETGALYGVWVSRSGGGGPTVRRAGGWWELEGTMRFCSGASGLDRALVAAIPARGGEQVLLDIPLRDDRVRPVPGSWRAPGMDAAESLDVTMHGVSVPDTAVIGQPGFYTGRAGFALGGAGVAAVWFGGAAGLVDDAFAQISSSASRDPHRLAHLGALHSQLAATEALLLRVAGMVDGGGDNPGVLTATCRAAAERLAWETLDRVPKILGAVPLCHDSTIAARVADLGVYVRQHHGERELAALAESLIECAL